MTYRLTITAPAFQHILQQTTTTSQRPFIYPAGLSRLQDSLEFLLHTTPGSLRSLNHSSVSVVGFNILSNDVLRTLVREESLPRSREHPGVLLVVGHRAAAGYLGGICLEGGDVKPLAAVRVLGPGLLQVRLLAQVPFYPHSHSPDRTTQQESLSNALGDRVIWSRTIGALGEESWTHLRSLAVAIIGCGRTGSLAAAALRRMGVDALTFIDPDRLEPNNVGEMDVVTLADIGTAKVEALGRHLRHQPFDIGAALQYQVTDAQPTRLLLISESILSLRALLAAKEADLLLCCVDNAAARLAAAILAKLYLRPLLDLGTGIFRSDSTERQMGADIRLILPDRCLLCFGGIPHSNQAHATVLSDNTVEALPLGNDWREQRSGSLRSLNQVAVGRAMRLIEDLIGGRLRTSTWLHVEFSAEGIPTIENRVPGINASCRLCTLTALGDDGLREVTSLLADLRVA